MTCQARHRLLATFGAAVLVALGTPTAEVFGTSDRQLARQPALKATSPLQGDTTCRVIFTSASPGFMQFCVSANGNIVEFQSPAGSEHLRVQTIAEGYTICDRPNLIEAPINHGFDMAFDSGGFDASTVIAAPPPAVFGVTRTTSDRVYRVTQTFLRDPSDLAVAVTMTVTNRTFRPRFGVSVSRQFDGDLDNGPFDDRYLRTADTVLGWQSSTGHGLELTAQSSTTAHRTFVQRFSDWFGTGLAPPLYRGCFFDDEPTPTATGDFVGAIVYNLGVLGPFQSKSVTFLYHRI